VKALKRILALACVAAGASALAQQFQPLGNSKPAQQTRVGRTSGPHPDINQGRFVAIGGEFGTLRTACSQCHQVDGAGDPSGAFPRLTSQSAWYLYSALRDFADGNRLSDVMTPIAKQMSDAQMQDVAAFYASLRPTGSPTPTPEKATAQSGQNIAHAGLGNGKVPGCNTCHGGNGAGNPPLYPYLAGQYRPYLEAQLEAFKNGTRQSLMNVMNAIAGNLNDQQIKDVAVYYASLSPQRITSGMQLKSQRPAQGTQTSGSEEVRTPRNGSTAEDLEHVGATPHPKVRPGSTVLPSGSSGQSAQKP
jgi:cytochrome c553